MIVGADRQPARFPLDLTADDIEELVGAGTYRVYAIGADGEVLDWYSFRDGWAGYSLNSFTLAANRSSAVLRVTDSLNHTFQTTVTVDSARLRVRTDASGHSMAYVVGSYNDFTWQQVAQSTGQSGEGEAAEAADRAEMLAAVFGGSGNYAAAVDAALDDVVG